MSLPPFLRVVLRLLLLGVAISMLCRVVLFAVNAPLWRTASMGDIVSAFLDRGLLFDLYVHSLILAVPTLLLGATWLMNSRHRWPVIVSRWVYTTLFIVLVAFSCMDIPFFTQFNFRVTRAALTWMDTPWQSLKEVFTTPGYFIAFVGLLVLGTLGARMIGRMFRPLLDPAPVADRSRTSLRAAGMVPVLLLLFVGVRGNWDPQGHRLSSKDAYYCTNPFLNQLGLNAGFTFIDSFDDDEVHYMEDTAAVAHARASLGITSTDASHPFARPVAFDSTAHKWNVVLIIVESLSAERMAHFGNTARLTPFLDSLADHALFFDHFYSSGVHTHNGVFSTLYGWPVVGDRPSMADARVRDLQFNGLPQVLKANGYGTAFFYVGEKEFDNMGGFLPRNGFDAMFGNDDYDPKWKRTSWGVPDHALYAEGLQRIDALASKGPFFATFLTISSHASYNVPTDVPFKPASTKSDENIYQYMDWAMSRFFAEAGTHSWSDHTLFVITGDHGQAFDRTYEMPLSYQQIPLIVFAPGLVAPRTDHRLGGQVDVPETVLGLLQLPHVDNSLGIDLTRAYRRFAFFSADSRLGAVDQDFFWTLVGDREQLYHWPDRDPLDHLTEHVALADSMRMYAQSMTQAAKWAIEEKRVSVP